MKRVKQSQVASFLIVAIVYILSAVAGIAIYNMLDLTWWLSLLIADAAATVITFIFSVIFDNASVYDPYWSVQPIVILWCSLLQNQLTVFGILLLSVVSAWGIRLTLNWAYTFGNLMHQDWRYTMLKEKTGKLYFAVNFLGIHMVPTLVVYGCILPAVYAIINGTAANVWSLIFLGVSLLAVTMQGCADYQMHKFRRNRTGSFIRDGLWKYSRHPNYLGEMLMWWGIALSVICASPDVWYLCAGAAANTILFLVVSIPMADGRQSKKAGFIEYKAQTRMLLPIKKF